MWKVMLVHPEIMDAEQPTWEILKLIIQAQYQITALGIIVLIAIAAIIIGVNWVGAQRKVKKITIELIELQEKMNSIKEAQKKTKDETEIELLTVKGESARIIAIMLRMEKNWEKAADWAALSIEHFCKAGRTDVGEIIDPFIDSIKQSEFIQVHVKREMMKHINYIPDEFKDKKEEIRELINKLPVKENKKKL